MPPDQGHDAIMSNRPSDLDSEDETPLSALVHHWKEVTASDLIDTEDEVPIAVLKKRKMEEEEDETPIAVLKQRKESEGEKGTEEGSEARDGEMQQADGLVKECLGPPSADEEKEEKEEEGDEEDEEDFTQFWAFTSDQYNSSSDSSFDSYVDCSETITSEENLDSSYSSDDSLGSDRLPILTPRGARSVLSSDESDYDWNTDDDEDTPMQPKPLWNQSKSFVIFIY